MRQERQEGHETGQAGQVMKKDSTKKHERKESRKQEQREKKGGKKSFTFAV